MARRPFLISLSCRVWLQSHFANRLISSLYETLEIAAGCGNVSSLQLLQCGHSLLQ